MNTIDRTAPLTLSHFDFDAKVTKLNTDLSTGKMWLNDKCETQTKNCCLVRWIKCIFSFILPIDFLSSIKASRVALSYFEFVRPYKDYLKDENVLKHAKIVLTTLNEKTHHKYTRKIMAYVTAIDGLIPKQAVVTKENIANDKNKEADVT